MIEVANDESPVTKIDELMQERDRIAAARDADEIWVAGGKILQRLRLEAEEVLGVLPHRVAQASSLPLTQRKLPLATNKQRKLQARATFPFDNE